MGYFKDLLILEQDIGVCIDDEYEYESEYAYDYDDEENEVITDEYYLLNKGKIYKINKSTC